MILISLFITIVALLVASLVLSVLALRRDSWRMMWGAALLSLLFSIIAGFSVGPLVFLLALLQFASALALQRMMPTRGWLVAVGTGVLLWIVIVPLQLIFDVVVLPWLLAFVAVGMASSTILFLGSSRSLSVD